MKVIDLLNKIANGEEPKIKYDNVILKYNKKEERFIDKDGLNSLYEIDFSELNDEVETLEEEKKIEKIEKYYEFKDIDNNEDNKEYKEYYENILKVYGTGEYEIDEALSFTIDKINELIDEINKLKKEDNYEENK